VITLSDMELGIESSEKGTAHECIPLARKWLGHPVCMAGIANVELAESSQSGVELMLWTLNISR